MPIFDLFSKRQKRLRGELPDVFVYDVIPPELRVQIIHIWRDAFGPEVRNGHKTPARGLYEMGYNALCREYGVFVLGGNARHRDGLENFFRTQVDVDRAMDVIELMFGIIDKFVRKYDSYDAAGCSIKPDDAIDELNARFLEWGIGYQYLSGEIIRKDSEYLHQEAVKPALSLLADSRYKGAQDEFLTAHEHYRHGNVKDALSNCLKSLESTLKTICKIRHWQYDEKDTAKTLLETCFKNELIPAFLQSHYSALKSTLESGVPTIRNRLGGHGQGAEVVDVPPHYAAYMIHTTASAILFLIEAAKAI